MDSEEKVNEYDGEDPTLEFKQVMSEYIEAVRLLTEDGGAADPDMPVPFSADTFLIGVEVAGTNHIENIEELYSSLELGERVALYREPTNAYDSRAIVVKTLMGDKLGYVPAYQNLILSRLIDAGYDLYATVRHKEILNGDFYKIVIKIYLRDSSGAEAEGEELTVGGY